MPFTSYLLSKFENTHENVFFRDLSSELERAFGNEAGNSVMLGNVSCNGHQIDAIFIRTGQITVLDFKDYSGTLTFAENNPWRLTDTNNRLVFVQGGAQNRNPFQQVRAYRFTLADFLAAHSQMIFTVPREDIDWFHTGCIVLFHRNIEFDNSTIPQQIQRWFQVSDRGHVVNDLSDRVSQKLAFTDNEIRGILNVFNVHDNNRLDHINIEEPVTRRPVHPSRLALIQRLLAGGVPLSEYEKLIHYYRTLISVERYKEPEASDITQLHFNPQSPREQCQINFNDAVNFHDLWLSNLQEHFPKNLFIALNLVMDGRQFPLLHTVLLASDIGNQNNIQVDLNTLDVYPKVLEELELSEDIIEEISGGVSARGTLDEKLTVLSEILGTEVTIGSSIVIGLSTESLFTSQLNSELGKLARFGEAGVRNNLFKDFLFNKQTVNAEKYDIHPMIQITDLNKSQRDAVSKSFSQPITVITGPPGTGKSQVVLNILANAIASGKSVLFASKNNKAVDTVKERFDSIVGENYLIRFGSREEIESNAKPALRTILQIKNNGGYAFNEAEYLNLQSQIRTRRERINKIEALLDSIPVKETELNKYRADKLKLVSEHENWRSKLDLVTVNLFQTQGLRVKADTTRISYYINKIDKWNSGWLNRLFFRILSEKELVGALEQFSNDEAKPIKDLITEIAPWAVTNDNILISAKRHLEYLKELKNKESECYNKQANHNKAIKELDSKISSLENELSRLNNDKPNLEAELNQLLNGFADTGIVYLRMAIKKKLSVLDTTNLQSFINSLPANNIWMDEDVAVFTRVTTRFLNDFNAICVTSLSAKNNVPLSSALFDLLVIDEASQCDIASALPLIYRAKKVAIIGDPLQLKHITSVADYEEEYLAERLNLQSFQLKYYEKSLYDYGFGLAVKSNLGTSFLDEHYRSHSQIIGFSNTHFYERRLGQTMTIRTRDEDFMFGNPGINWINVRGEMHQERNINQLEINRCIHIANSLKVQFPNASIGIVTPFRDQYRAIFNLLQQQLRGNVKVDTVHKYQGDEKDIIIFSLVVAEGVRPGKSAFINRNDYLINVAITRARSALYIVGDHNYCRNLRYGYSHTPLSALAYYVEGLKKVVN